MATDLKPEPKAAPASKYEQFVEQQLERARRRIRKLDTLTSVLVLLIGVLVYGLTMAALDRAFDLPAAVRAAAFITAAAVAACYAALIVFRRIQWHVNPYYAARRLEETVPNAKNSLINWLDLRDEEMPPVIRGTLGRKAAKDLKEADLEGAVSGRRPVWLAAVAGALTLALLVWYVTAPGQLRSLLQRALLPFDKAVIDTRTHLALLAPAGGDATVPVRQDVQIRVQVTGRVPRVNQPDALKLHYRYRQSDPYLVRPLDEDADGQWFKTVLADDVQDGFFYKVTGGDTETPEHRIKVRALPQVTRFDVTYHYRPYLRRPDLQAPYGPTETFPRPDMKELRGTEVTLLARTNRVWHTGHLALQQGATVQKLEGEPVADDPQAKRFQFVLDADGSFSVQFTSAEGEANSDRSAYTIKVIEDTAPRVGLTKPGKNVELPANGTLALEGWARDDFGLKGMTLRLRVKKGPQTPDLEPRPYQPGVDLKLADGTYPTELVYNDLVALEKLKTSKGQAFPLKAGMVLEYWLEAVDNCDYPDKTGHVGKSEPYLVTIVAPDKDEQRQQQERQKAQQEKAQRDKELAREQQRRNQQAQEKKKAERQDPEQRAKHAKQEEERQQRAQQEMEKVRQELERQQKQREQKGTAKGAPDAEKQPNPPDKGPKQDGPGAKAGNEDKTPPKDGQGAQNNNGGKEPKKGEQPGAGQQPQSDKKDPAKGETPKDGKGPDQKQAPSQAKGEGGQQQPGQQAGAGKEKGGAKEEKSDMGKSKDQGQGGMGGGQQAASKEPGGQDGNGQQAAQAKGDGTGAGGQQPPQGQNGPKDGPKSQGTAEKGNGNDPATGQPKQDKQVGNEGPAKLAQGDRQGQQGAQTKGNKKGPGNEGNGSGASKAAGAKGDGPKGSQGGGAGKTKGAAPQQAQAAGQGKGERGADDGQRPEEATLEDVARLKEMLERQPQQEEALEELDRARKEVRNPAVREALEELAKKYGRDAVGKAAGEPKDPARPPDKLVKGGPKGGNGQPVPKGQNAEKGNGTGQGGKQGPPKSDKREGNGEGGKQVGNGGEPRKGGKQPRGDRAGRGANGPDENLEPNPVDEAAARRAGELQLEKLRDRLRKNPELMKKMQWTQQDVDRFIERARAYQDWLRRQQKAAGDEKRPGAAGKNVLPGFNPRLVGPRADAVRDPLQLGVAQPPPEFREAQRLFTSKPRE